MRYVFTYPIGDHLTTQKEPKIIYNKPPKQNQKPPKAKKQRMAISIYDLATILDAKYKLTQRFYRSPEFKTLFNKWMTRAAETYLNDSSDAAENNLMMALRAHADQIRAEYQNYLRDERHGIQSEAAKRRGSKAFYDTGQYFRGLFVTLQTGSKQAL